ncbi:RAE1-like protein isoform X2 [Tanacetum coccineum]
MHAHRRFLCIKLALRLESRNENSFLRCQIVSVPGIGRSLAVVAALDSRIHCFEDKLMDLEPHDPYAKTIKRVAVLAEEQMKTTEKDNLDNKRMLLDLLRTRVNLEANVPIFKKDQYLCIIELAIIYSRPFHVKEGSGLAEIGLSKTIPIVRSSKELQGYRVPKALSKRHAVNWTNIEYLCRSCPMYWDLRQQTLVHTQQLSNSCYALLVKHPLMVVGTTDRNLIAFNLQNQVQYTFKLQDGAFNFWDKDSKQRLKIKKPSKKDTVSCTGLDEPSSRKRNQRNKPRENKNIVYTEDEYEYEDEDEYVDGDEVEDEDDHVGS